MTVTVTTPEQLINMVLARIGYPTRIGNLFEGSKAADAALDVYSQTRDAVMRTADWGFAEKIIAATTTGNTPPAPWSDEYVYPTDCLRMRNMFNSTYTANLNNPVPNLYTVGNNGTAKVIWCNIASMTLVYTAQITNPAQWEAAFVEALAAALARRLSPMLASTPDMVKLEAQDEADEFKIASGIEG